MIALRKSLGKKLAGTECQVTAYIPILRHVLQQFDLLAGSCRNAFYQ